MSFSIAAGLLIVAGFLAIHVSALAISPEQQEALDRHRLDQIKVLFQQNQYPEALSLLEKFQNQSPESRLLDEAYFLEAGIRRAQGNNKEATRPLEQLIEEFPASPLLDDARLMLGSLYVELEQNNRALAVLNNTLLLSTDSNAHSEALRQIREIYEQEGNYTKAIQVSLAEANRLSEHDRRDLLDHIQTLILQHMTEGGLGDLLDLYPATYPGDLAMIRLIELHTAQGDEVLAERDIRSFLHRFPNHPYAQTAMALLQSFVSKIKAHDHVVATLLPFSGKMKPFAEETLNGIRLALEDASQSLGPNAIGLVVKESATTPSTMRHTYSQMLDEFKPIAVIGPLLAREIQVISSLPDQSETPFVTPSATLTDVRQFGRYWFSTALTSTLQVSKLVDYAVGTLGYHRFCIIVPEGAYGRELQQQFQKRAQERGAEIIAVESYKPGTTDITPQIQHLKKTDLERYGEIMIMSGKPRDKREVYRPGFDAVFVPGRPVDVAFIAAQLAFYDIKMPLLGTNGWNSPELVKWGGSSVEGGIFVDGVFLQTPDPQLQAFFQRYSARFGRSPSLFAIQAYDAMHVIADTIRHGASTGTDVRDQLYKRHELPTLSGLTAFGPGGILDRKIFLLQVQKRRFAQLN